jgi:hypothetical protein
MFLGSFTNFEESDGYLCHVCPSVCPHVTTRFTLDGSSWRLVFNGFFLKICRACSSFIKSLTRKAGVLQKRVFYISGCFTLAGVLH